MFTQHVSVSFVFPIMKTLLRKGYDWGEFCLAASLDVNLLQDVEARIPEQELARIVQAAADYTGDELFGLHQGQEVSMADLGVVGYVMLHSKTLGQALTAYQKYNMITCSGYNADYEVHQEDVRIRLYASHPSMTPSRHCTEDMAGSLLYIMMSLAGRPIRVKEVNFMHQPALASEEYLAVFGVLPRFGQEANTLRLSKEILDYPVLSSDIRLLGVFEAVAEETKNRLIQGAVLSGKLYKWLIESMPGGFPTLQEAAEAMRMSPRNLQTRLKQEDASFTGLANRVRKELAASYLAKPEYSIGEIAYLLHFSEPSAFQNTFKKWMGISPGQYRLQMKDRSRAEETSSA